jgi:O-Antigen ligase
MATPLERLERLIPYQCGLAFLSVLIFSTNLDIYGDSTGLLPLSPLHWVVLYFLGSIPLMMSFGDRKRYFSRSVLLWCGGYFLISLVSFWIFSGLQLTIPEAFQELKDRILCILFFLNTLLVYSQFNDVQMWARIGFIFAGIIGTAANFYEFFNPMIFGGLNETGRPAGFYVNSNNSGAGLMQCLLIGTTLLRPVYRIPYALLMGAGVFITFSRGALIAWLITVFIFIITGVFPIRMTIGWGLGLVIATFVFMAIGSSFINMEQLQDAGLLNSNVTERLSQTSGGEEVKDDSTLARLAVVAMAWKMFMAHPIIGNGIGSTLKLDVGNLVEHPISTHNIYLYFLADHGIVGGLLFPVLIMTIIYPLKSKHLIINICSVIFLLLWGLFSHNLVSLRLHLTFYALLSAINQPHIMSLFDRPKVRVTPSPLSIKPF